MALAFIGRAMRFSEVCSMEAAEAIQAALAAAQRSQSAAKRHEPLRTKVLHYAVGKEDMSASQIADGFLEYYADELGDKPPDKRTVAGHIRHHRKHHDVLD